MYCFVVLLMGIQVGSFGPALVEVSHAIGASLSDTAYGSSIRTVTSMIASLCGPLYDKAAGHKLLALTCLLCAVGNTIVALAANVSLFYLGMAFQGISSGLLDVGVNLLMLWLFAGDTHGNAWMQGLHFGFSVGATLASLAIGSATAGAASAAHSVGGVNATSLGNTTDAISLHGVLVAAVFGSDHDNTQTPAAMYVYVALATAATLSSCIFLIIPSPHPPAVQAKSWPDTSDAASAHAHADTAAAAHVQLSLFKPATADAILHASGVFQVPEDERVGILKQPWSTIVDARQHFHDEIEANPANTRAVRATASSDDDLEVHSNRSVPANPTINADCRAPSAFDWSHTTSPSPVTLPAHTPPSTGAGSSTGMLDRWTAALQQPLAVKWQAIGITCVIVLLYVGCEHTFGNYVTSYAMLVVGEQESTAQLIVAGYWGAMTVGRGVSIIAALYLSPATLLLLSVTGSVCVSLLLWIEPSSFPALVVITVLFGLALAPQYPSAIALAGSLFTLSAQHTTALSIANSCGAWTLPLMVAAAFGNVSAASATEATVQPFAFTFRLVLSVGTLLTLAMLGALLRYRTTVNAQLRNVPRCSFEVPGTSVALCTGGKPSESIKVSVHNSNNSVYTDAVATSTVSQRQNGVI